MRREPLPCLLVRAALRTALGHGLSLVRSVSKMREERGLQGGEPVDEYRSLRFNTYTWQCERCGSIVRTHTKLPDEPPSEHCRRCKVQGFAVEMQRS